MCGFRRKKGFQTVVGLLMDGGRSVVNEYKKRHPIKIFISLNTLFFRPMYSIRRVSKEAYYII